MFMLYATSIVLLLIVYVDASTFVYNCSEWPKSLESFIIVDCPGLITSASRKINSSLWQGTKFIIDVSSNSLQGSLNFVSPSQQIRDLSVADNELTGSLPASMPAFLQQLDFSGNGFSGTLPAGWSTSTGLSSINLEGNTGVLGSVPSAWTSLTNLQLLDLRKTGMGGEFPSSLSSLQKLTSLLIDGCNFTGCVPVGIPFDTTSTQAPGFIVRQCTSAPSRSPSKAPSTSRPSTRPSYSPSTSPSLSPTFPTRFPTFKTRSPVPSPTAAPTAGANVGLGIGIGVAIALIAIVAFTGFIYFRRGRSGKSQSSANAGAMLSSPNPARSTLAVENNQAPAAPSTSSSSAAKTFIPGRGWVQSDKVARPTVPPPAAPPPRSNLK